jgi:hypothetical protein
MVESVLKDVYGQTITIETVVDEGMKVDDNSFNPSASIVTNTPVDNSAPANTSTVNSNNSSTGSEEDILNNVLKTFGGKLI